MVLTVVVLVVTIVEVVKVVELSVVVEVLLKIALNGLKGRLNKFDILKPESSLSVTGFSVIDISVVTDSSVLSVSISDISGLSVDFGRLNKLEILFSVFIGFSSSNSGLSVGFGRLNKVEILDFLHRIMQNIYQETR